MTRFTIIAIVALITTTAHAQGLVPYYGPDGQVYYRGAPDPGYAPPGVPPDIIAPERPRGAPRPRNVAPPIAVAPLEPLSLCFTARSGYRRLRDVLQKRLAEAIAV